MSIWEPELHPSLRTIQPIQEELGQDKPRPPPLGQSSADEQTLQSHLHAISQRASICQPSGPGRSEHNSTEHGAAVIAGKFSWVMSSGMLRIQPGLQLSSALRQAP